MATYRVSFNCDVFLDIEGGLEMDADALDKAARERWAEACGIEACVADMGIDLDALPGGRLYPRIEHGIPVSSECTAENERLENFSIENIEGDEEEADDEEEKGFQLCECGREWEDCARREGAEVCMDRAEYLKQGEPEESEGETCATKECGNPLEAGEGFGGYCASCVEWQTVTATMPVRIKKAIAHLVDYNWTEERDDYADHQDDGTVHIFETLVELDNWLNGTNRTPESYLREGQRA